MTLLDKSKRLGMIAVAEIDSDELAVRMLEAMLETKRPAGLTATQALEDVDQSHRDSLRRAVRAAMEYWGECISKMQSTN